MLRNKLKYTPLNPDLLLLFIPLFLTLPLALHFLKFNSRLSNLLKFVEDVLIGIAYHDDSQVCKIECTKKYGLQPQTLVILTQIDPTGI